MSSTDVEVVSNGNVTQRARDGYDAKTIALIKNTVAAGATDAELGLFLEVSARYQLDPFAKEIWCVKMPGKNGSGGSMGIIVARDGFLEIANRHPDVLGMHSDTVCENDAGDRVIVKHVAGKPGERGKIVGAFAVVRRKDKTDSFFYAALSEYRPKSEAKLKYSPWGAQESAMIIKCAEAVALRKAFSVSGVMGEGEEDRVTERTGLVTAVNIDDEGLPVDLSEDVQIVVREAIEEQRKLDIDPWRPAKVKAVFAGANDTTASEIAERLAAESALFLQEQPVDAEVVDG